MGKKYGNSSSKGLHDYMDDYQTSFGFSGSGKYTKCSDTHPVLKLGGGTFIGGSCINPRVDNADVYIGFDHGMSTIEYLPWESHPHQVMFLINDMQAPKHPEQFRKLVDWTIEQLAQGKTVHAGCIGGHGRTGTFLTAVMAVLDPTIEDHIGHMRKLYCHKAVESTTQVQFLHKHYGVKIVSGHKDDLFSKSKWKPTATGGREFKDVIGAAKTLSPPMITGRPEGRWKPVKSKLGLSKLVGA